MSKKPAIVGFSVVVRSWSIEYFCYSAFLEGARLLVSHREKQQKGGVTLPPLVTLSNAHLYGANPHPLILFA